MKIGKEIEGRLLGLNTLFMQAEEFRLFRRHDLVLSPLADRLAKVKSIPSRDALTHVCAISHWYVSDHQNVLTGEEDLFDDLASAGIMVTLEITKVSLKLRPPYATLMLTLPAEVVEEFKKLGPTDQVKFSNKAAFAHEVWSVMPRQMVYTAQEEFFNDVDLGRCVGLDGTKAYWEV